RLKSRRVYKTYCFNAGFRLCFVSFSPYYSFWNQYIFINLKVMKKNLMILLVLLISSTSCQKFLDTKPTNFITPEYKTIAQLETGLAGVYDALGSVYQDDWPYWINATSDIEYDRTGQTTTAIYV